jgi:hypothetical protein
VAAITCDTRATWIVRFEAAPRVYWSLLQTWYRPRGQAGDTLYLLTSRPKKKDVSRSTPGKAAMHGGFATPGKAAIPPFGGFAVYVSSLAKRTVARGSASVPRPIPENGAQRTRQFRLPSEAVKSYIAGRAEEISKAPLDLRKVHDRWASPWSPSDPGIAIVVCLGSREPPLAAGLGNRQMSMGDATLVERREEPLPSRVSQN